MHILIADDDRVLNHLMSSVFRKHGWTVSTAVMELGAAEFLKNPQNPELVVEAATRLTKRS